MGAQTGLAALCAFVLTAMCLDGATAQRDCYGAVVGGLGSAARPLQGAPGADADLPRALASPHTQVEVAVLLRGEHTPLEAFYGYPAPFGAFAAGLLNDTAWPAAAVAVAEPLEACGPIEPPVQPGAAAVVARGNCSFAEKAWAVQKAGYAAMLLFNTAPGAAEVGAACAAWPSCVGTTHGSTSATACMPVPPPLCVPSGGVGAPCLLLACPARRLADPHRPLPARPPAAECVFMQAFQNETQGLSIAVVSLTAQAGAGLQALAAQYPGAGQLVLRLRLPAEAAVDWSTLALWAMAVGTVTVGALWAGHGNWALGRDGGTPGKKVGGRHVGQGEGGTFGWARVWIGVWAACGTPAVPPVLAAQHGSARCTRHPPPPPAGRGAAEHHRRPARGGGLCGARLVHAAPALLLPGQVAGLHPGGCRDPNCWGLGSSSVPRPHADRRRRRR